MDTDRYLSHLAADGPRLAAVAERNLDAPVPGCPGWTVRDLVLHVADVYRHKVAVLRDGKPPEQGSVEHGDIDAVAYLRESFEAIVAELQAHAPDEPAWIWADPATGNTRWWVRRMAQETVVHRLDAEQAVGDVTPIDPELAVDGVDELLAVFLPAVQANWPEELEAVLHDGGGQVVEVRTGGRRWSFAMHPGRLEFSPDGAPAVTVDGEPEAVLLWLWGRTGPQNVTLTGDEATQRTLRRVLDAAGQ